MQIQKTTIEKRILKEAENEFREYGFAKASMRRIAARADVSTSNIYNYFKSKDELFGRVVNPTIKIIDNYFTFMESGNEHKNTQRWSYQAHLEAIEILADFLDQHRENLKLIAFKSGGASVEKYKEKLIDRYSEISLRGMSLVNKIRPEIKLGMSEFFIHNISSLWLNMITEILMHDVEHGEMLKFLKEMMLFMFYGYEGLTEYDFSNLKPKPLGK